MIKFGELQDAVDKFLVPPERNSLELLCGQLCSEAGEVFGKLTKIRRLQKKIADAVLDTLNRSIADVQIDEWNKELNQLWEDFRKELGDTQFYLAVICNYQTWELHDIATENIQKLHDRKNRNVLTSGSGDNR